MLPNYFIVDPKNMKLIFLHASSKIFISCNVLILDEPNDDPLGDIVSEIYEPCIGILNRVGLIDKVEGRITALSTH
jgi:hypothetical protein